jgi:HK97 family phage major capsid protein
MEVKSMTKINELIEKRARAWEQAKAFLDSHRDERGLISAEDNATYEKMEQDIVNYGKEIERLQRMDAFERELNAPTSTPLTSKPGTVDNAGKTGRASAEYNTAFWAAFRNQRTPDVMNSLKIGVDSDGGYLVPDEFEKTLVQALHDENVFRRNAKVIQTSSGERKIPVSATKGRAAWVEEEGLIPETDEAFDLVTIGAHKLGVTIKASEELLNDSVFDIQSYISTEFARLIAAAEEDAFFNGNGVCKPLGILADNGGAEIGVTTAGANITFDDVMDLFYSLRAPYRNKANFYLNDTTVKLIRKLKDSNGNYLWQPSLQADVPDKILNRPYYTTPFMPTAEAGNKAIAFGDFKYYWIADRQGRSFKRLNELYAATGQVGFIATERVDGKLILPEAVKVLQLKG